MHRKEIFLIAGEASGDLHGANLIKAIRELAPFEIGFSGIGGELMKKQGLRTLYDASLLSVVGLTEILREIRHIYSAYSLVKRYLKNKRPDLLVLIDYPGFNLKVLRYASRLGIPVMYYITPQVWAWKEHRTKLLRSFCNACAVILPFEEGFLRKRGVNARFVGHPLVDVIHVEHDREEFLSSLGLDPGLPTIGLLPGSRKGELRRHLPIMVETANLLKKDFDCQFVLPIIDKAIISQDMDTLLKEAGIKIVVGKTYDAMNASDALLLASGTVTLEATILEVPHVVMYRVSPITYTLGRIFVKIPHISLTNIVAEKEVVKEFIQEDANPATLSSALKELLSSKEKRLAVIRDLKRVKDKLGGPGASRRAAQMALELIQ
ncbi:Lipid-A-disaccharide synthase [Dissulfuribacter thermophilus]|uniref:Lipid-A-disaccharide synthase n=1 Tax=Dissulfuribacter thermophilus TaxID=1156395 RepID=A0A1B9F4X1_9BACT|nr:lipid-A-disaccharide synthase [Dissulfuribacter thermophilus]OCC14903.1 Lipid-A-disaccharide synthase [Dissulfuribacter thermophilus]